MAALAPGLAADEAAQGEIAAGGCAVLLVTHDVEEAVLLADRVLVMDDGVIAHEQRIDLDRPRDITDPRFAELRAGLLERLGVDTAAEAA